MFAGMRETRERQTERRHSKSSIARASLASTAASNAVNVFTSVALSRVIGVLAARGGCSVDVLATGGCRFLFLVVVNVVAVVQDESAS